MSKKYCYLFTEGNATMRELLGIKVDTQKLSPEEWNRTNKIRRLDEHGKLVVDYLIDEEYARVLAAAAR